MNESVTCWLLKWQVVLFHLPVELIGRLYLLLNLFPCSHQLPHKHILRAAEIPRCVCDFHHGAYFRHGVLIEYNIWLPFPHASLLQSIQNTSSAISSQLTSRTLLSSSHPWITVTTQPARIRSWRGGSSPIISGWTWTLWRWVIATCSAPRLRIWELSTARRSVSARRGSCSRAPPASWNTCRGDRIAMISVTRLSSHMTPPLMRWIPSFPRWFCTLTP